VIFNKDQDGTSVKPNLNRNRINNPNPGRRRNPNLVRK
jgi:hypothetical protein